MKKILHISKYYYPFSGGTEQIARDVVLALKGEYEQKVIAFNDGKEDKLDIVDGIEVTKCGCFTKIAAQSLSVSYGKHLHKVMKEFNPDIVVFHYPNPFVTALLLRELKNTKAKLVVYWHLDIVRQKYLKLLFAPQNRSLLARADKVIATSPNYIEGSKWLQSVSYPLQLETEDIQRVKETLVSMVEKLGIRNGSMNVELVVDKNNCVWLIDVGPRSGGNMIPDLLGDMFGVDIAEMSVEAAMGTAITGDIHEPNGFYATHNLHSDKNGVYKDIVFSPEIEPYIYRKCLYKKAGDAVEYFDNAAKCLGIVFFKFPNENVMRNVLEHINDLITVELQ